jgi:hypothetical protein
MGAEVTPVKFDLTSKRNNLVAGASWIRQRIFAWRNFRKANAVKCHPEPASKKSRSRYFCGRDSPGFSGFARAAYF